jgi:dTDP-4-amino-4,6-dideoxygalactose transaminase
MRNIQMVDLGGQYQKIRAEINTAIQDVIDSTAYIRGPEVKLFQASLSDYLGTRHTITCGNGTDALQVAMMALDLKPGDEVITSPFTFISTIEVIKLLGLKPVLADIEASTFNIDPEKIEKVISKRTRAIVPVHLFGQCADMEKINLIAGKNGLFVIEDAAQSLGSDYFFKEGRRKKSGTIGTIGCTSFFPSKNLGTFGDGGAIFTDDPVLASRMYSITNHGMTEKYHYDLVGLNSRLDTIQAAILNVKLKYLDQYNQARREAAAFYDRIFSQAEGISIPEKKEFTTHIYHQYTLKVQQGKRNDLKAFLEKNRIPSMIYYPAPVHLQPAYLDLGYGHGAFPVAESISRMVLSLPMHTELDEEQLSYITAKVMEFLN